VLGILAWKGLSKIAELSGELISDAGDKLERKLKDDMIDLRRKVGASLFEEIAERLDNDPQLNAMIPEYHDLVDQEKSIKGKNVPAAERTALSKKRKRVATSLTRYVNLLVSDSLADLDSEHSDTVASFKKAGGHMPDIRQQATKHARRRR
jgi:hypothetical protein